MQCLGPGLPSLGIRRFKWQSNRYNWFPSKPKRRDLFFVAKPSCNSCSFLAKWVDYRGLGSFLWRTFSSSSRWVFRRLSAPQLARFRINRTPAKFRFAWKASSSLPLETVECSIGKLHRTAVSRLAKCGPVLFQLFPQFRADRGLTFRMAQTPVQHYGNLVWAKRSNNVNDDLILCMDRPQSVGEHLVAAWRKLLTGNPAKVTALFQSRTACT